MKDEPKLFHHQREFIHALTRLIKQGKLVSVPPRTGLIKCRLEDFEKDE